MLTPLFQFLVSWVTDRLIRDQKARSHDEDALELQRLREHAGQKLMGGRLCQLLSRTNEQCRHRPVARSQRLSGQGGL